jgi:hypothetical protein
MKTSKIEKILESISSEILTDEVKQQIAESFTEAVDAKVEEKGRLIAENELNKMDADHTAMMEKILEAQDADHVNKFKTAVATLDKQQSAKLQVVIEKYEKELKEGAESLREELIGKVSNYLDLYLEESIPKNQLQEAVENSRARRMINEVKKIVAVDPEFIDENFKEALKDGHDKIENLRDSLNTQIKENVDLNQSLINAKSELIIEQKTKDLTEQKRTFVTKLLEGKKPEEIEENFKFVVEMYDREESDRVLVEKNKYSNATTVLKENIDSPASLVNENNIQPNESAPAENAINSYVTELEGQTS